MQRRFRIDPRGSLPLLHQELVAAGWKPAGPGDEPALLWAAAEPPPAVYAELAPGRLVNHFPGIGAIARKDSLAATVGRARALLASRGVDLAARLPETYAMPEQLGVFLARARANPGLRWIQKPRAGARGEGVALLEDLDRVETGPNWLVQEYLDRPHLIEGRKYTLRWYALVTALDPLTVWVLDDGFTKLASREYSLRGDALGDRLRHLTNPDVQATNPEVATSADNLTRGAYADLLQEEGRDPAALFAAVEELIAATLCAARDQLSRSAWRATSHPECCFELLGVDVFVDADFRPWLLECNMSPSLSVEAASAADAETCAFREERDLKADLVREVLRVVGAQPGEDADRGGPRLRQLLPGGDAGPAFARFLPYPRPADGAPAPALLPAARVTGAPLADWLVLHEPLAGEVHVLDPVAAYAWTAWNEGLAPDSIALELSAAFPEAAWRAQTDVLNTFAEWLELGLAVEAAGGRSPATPPTSRSSSSRLRWNRERAYRCLDTVACVLVPDDEVDGWLQVVLGPVEDEDAETIDLRVEVVAARSGWEIVADGQPRPCRSPRQLGSIVRHLLISRAIEASPVAAVVGTVLDEPEGARLLVLGEEGLRALLAQAWVRDGGLCAADHIVLLCEDGIRGDKPIGLELPLGTTWFGPLPGLGDAHPVHLATSGGFARMWLPPTRPADASASLSAMIQVEAAATRSTRFAPRPMTPKDALRALLGSLPAESRVGATTMIAGAGLAEVTPAFRAEVPDPGIGRRLVSFLTGT